MHKSPITLELLYNVGTGIFSTYIIMYSTCGSRSTSSSGSICTRIWIQGVKNQQEISLKIPTLDLLAPAVLNSNCISVRKKDLEQSRSQCRSAPAGSGSATGCLRYRFYNIKSCFERSLSFRSVALTSHLVYSSAYMKIRRIHC